MITEVEDLTGKQLGRYRIITPLGEGGMATVYQGFQPGMDRYVALKILPRHFVNNAEFIDRFKREAKLIAQLQHPHILPVFDYGEDDGYAYLVMPLVEGGTLADLLLGRPLDLGHIRTIGSQVGDALDCAHARGVIHRDVKPSNVLIDKRGNCLLTDFGVAKMLEGSPDLTKSGIAIGTPAYMSPEQGLGNEVDARSDIYALGVILYEMATGRAPFEADTPMAVMIKHINDPLPRPSTVVGKEIPETLERVVLKCLAKEPNDRFPSAAEMVRALKAAVPEAHVAELVPAITRAAVLPPTDPKEADPGPAAIPPRGRSHTVVSAAPVTEPSLKAYSKRRRRLRIWAWLVALLIVLGVAYGVYGDSGALLEAIRNAATTLSSAASAVVP